LRTCIYHKPYGADQVGFVDRVGLAVNLIYTIKDLEEEIEHSVGFLPPGLKLEDPLKMKSPFPTLWSSSKTLINHKPYRAKQVSLVIRPERLLLDRVDLLRV